jgi:hypothetical protein
MRDETRNLGIFSTGKVLFCGLKQEEPWWRFLWRLPGAQL